MRLKDLRVSKWIDGEFIEVPIEESVFYISLSTNNRSLYDSYREKVTHPDCGGKCRSWKEFLSLVSQIKFEGFQGYFPLLQGNRIKGGQHRLAILLQLYGNIEVKIEGKKAYPTLPKRLVAGSWKDNFGWELCWFNPMMRAKRKKYEHMTIVAPRASEYLYEFVDKFLPSEEFGIENVEGEHWDVSEHFEWRGDRVVKERYRFRVDPKGHIDEDIDKEWRLLAPDNCSHVADVLCAFTTGDQYLGEGFKIIEPDLAQNMVNMFLDRGFSVACYGLGNSSFAGAVDLTGASLEEQCSALGAAKCAFGPSGAALHLSALCGTSYTTWYCNKRKSMYRHQVYWNPFNVGVNWLLGESHQLSSEMLVNTTIERFLSN